MIVNDPEYKVKVNLRLRREEFDELRCLYDDANPEIITTLDICVSEYDEDEGITEVTVEIGDTIYYKEV
jgi:hypothetical protein